VIYCFVIVLFSVLVLATFPELLYVRSHPSKGLPGKSLRLL